MARGLTTAQKALLAAKVRSPAFFVELLLSPVVRIWNGKGSVTVLSNSWSGVGEHGIIQGLTGNRNVNSQQLTLALCGIPGSYIDSGMIKSTRAVRYQGVGLNVYLGFCDVNTGLPLADPTIVWAGFADTMTFQLSNTVTCALTAEHFDSHLRRSNGWAMTTQSHNQRLGNPSPQDLFFEAQTRLIVTARPPVK